MEYTNIHKYYLWEKKAHAVCTFSTIQKDKMKANVCIFLFVFCWHMHKSNIYSYAHNNTLSPCIVHTYQRLNAILHSDIFI